MALALRRAGRLTPEIRLAQAISQFEASLSDREKADFKTLKSQAQSNTPGVQDVMAVTAEINKRTPKASIGPRFTNILMAVQQFATIGDVIIGGFQSLPACGVWCVVRTSLVLLVGLASHLERFSKLFMEIGKSSPRYQDLALLYSCSDRLKRDLTEYFVVVINICQQFLDYTKKSKLIQLTTSAFDTQHFQSESDLKRHALNIKEEVESLNTKTLVYESRENSRIRALVDRESQKQRKRRKFKRRSDYLSACTDFDHETPWKQARKRGNTTWFAAEKAYLEFKSCKTSSTLVLTGKLGSGKTVLAANVVDDLILSGNGVVCYFFIRHDITKGCQASIILRSFCRQLLSRHMNDDAIDMICAQDNPVLDDDAILALTKDLIKHSKRVFFLLDGLDELDTNDRQQIVSTLDYMNSFNTHDSVLLVFASLRSQADIIHSNYQGLYPNRLLSIPEENSDIGAFIDSELTAMIKSEQLVFGDPTIAVEIRDALLEGAHGMFLWVVLQLDCLCNNDMGTDDSIRRSLQDMPRDLNTLFSRILQRAKVTGPLFQSRLLKILVAAQRPLTVDEMREALSIAPADATLRPQQQINNIAHALASCGSLITVDEEEATVRFVHQSVSQFLLHGAENETVSGWHFTFHQASLELGQLLVTYLSYGVFDQQLSTTAVSNISVGQAPTVVVRHVLKDKSWKKAAALKLLRLRSQHDPDLGRTITEVSGAYQRSSKTQQVFHLLPYARKYWLLHTRTISSESSTFSLWRDLLTHPVFAEELHMASRRSHARMLWSWTALKVAPKSHVLRNAQESMERHQRKWSWTDAYDDKERYVICEFHPAVMRAITTSHLGLLSMELRGKYGLKALFSMVVYLLALQKNDVCPKLERPMWSKLWNLVNALQMRGLATDEFQFCDGSGGRLTTQYDLHELHMMERERLNKLRRVEPENLRLERELLRLQREQNSRQRILSVARPRTSGKKGSD